MRYHTHMLEPKKILFFPGAFNPPHLGHALIIETVLTQFKFDEVWIMPSGKRYDKVIATTYEDRLTLGTLFVEYVQSRVLTPVRLLTSNIDNIDGARSYDAILNEVFEVPNADITGLIGSDSFIRLSNKLGDAISRYKFIVIGRPGYAFPALFHIPQNVVVLDAVLCDVSSTHVRALVKREDSRYTTLVPETIAEYIEKHTLYRN